MLNWAVPCHDLLGAAGDVYYLKVSEEGVVSVPFFCIKATSVVNHTLYRQSHLMSLISDAVPLESSSIVPIETTYHHSRFLTTHATRSHCYEGSWIVSH